MKPMPRAAFLLPLLLLALTLVGVGWPLHPAAEPAQLLLAFHAFVGSMPLVHNQSSYSNPGGEGQFKVRDFQFFLSNIRLVSATGAFVEHDSYHLVRFDGDDPAFVIVLDGV